MLLNFVLVICSMLIIGALVHGWGEVGVPTDAGSWVACVGAHAIGIPCVVLAAYLLLKELKC